MVMMIRVLESNPNLTLILGLILLLIVLFLVPVVFGLIHKPKDSGKRQRDPHDFYRGDFEFDDTQQEQYDGDQRF